MLRELKDILYSERCMESLQRGFDIEDLRYRESLFGEMLADTDDSHLTRHPPASVEVHHHRQKV
jgi:hypothetical protein